MRTLLASLFGFATIAFTGCRCGAASDHRLVANTGELRTLPALHFGNVPVGQVSRLAFSVRNIGAASVDIQSQGVSDDPSASFTEPVPLKPQLPAGASGLGAVQFRPAAPGPLSATLEIDNDGAPDSVLRVALDGVGVDLRVTAAPPTIDFGSVQVGAQPAPSQVVAFSNLGAAAARVSIDLSATLPQFGLADSNGPLASGAGFSIPANGGMHLVEVSFEPNAIRGFSSAFGYTACGAGNVCVAERSIALNGAGIDGELRIVPDPIAFAGVAAGQSASQTVTVTNLGSNAVVVSCVHLKSLGGGACGTASALFRIGPASPGLPATLAAAGAGANSLRLSLTYTASGHPDSDELDVEGTAVGATVPLTAGAPIAGDQQLGPCQLAIVPSIVNFGTVTVRSAVSKAVTFSNHGQSACHLDGLRLDPSSDREFSLPAGAASSIAIPPGGSAPISVGFQLAAGSSASQSRGDLDYQSDDSNHPSGQVPLIAHLDPSNPYAGGWPKWHHDNTNSGQTAADTSGNRGGVTWKYAGLVSAVQLNAEGKGTANCGGEAYVHSPVVVNDPSGGGGYAVLQISLDGMLHAVGPDGGLLWKRKLSSPKGDPHPSTPAVSKTGTIWAISGSDGDGDQLYMLGSNGAIQYAAPYGEDGFDATPGLGPDGTLYEGDDDGQRSAGSDPYSAMAFRLTSSGSVDLVGGLSLPLTSESERFGVAIADDETSYWGNNGQFFAVSAPAAGFAQLAAWPPAGVTVVDNSRDADAVGPVFSDLALDPFGIGFVYTYSSWEDGTPVDCTPFEGCASGPPYTVQGRLAALGMADGSRKWEVVLPATQLPAGWTQLCADYGNASPAVSADGTVYVGNGDGLRAVDGATGQIQWTFPSANVSGSPAIGGDGAVFFGCSDGTFHAVEANGMARFSLDLGAPVSSSPAIGDDGTVFVTSDDGVIWAIK